MADGVSEEKVHKSLVMDRELAGAINAWASGAGVGFSEAVRRLCAQALVEWPNAAGAVVEELRRAEWRLLDELQRAEGRLSAALARLESQHSDLLAAVEGIGDEDEDPDRYYAYYGNAIVEDDEGDGDGDDPEGGGGFDADEFDREFDEWWEGKRHEWE